MDLKGLVSTLLPVLGEQGVKALTDEVNDLTAEANEPWKKAVLGLVANGVETFGPMGVQMATKAVEDLINGEDTDLSWADLDVASDILAHMQNAEADRMSASRDFLTKVGKVLGQIFGGFLKGLIASA